MYKFNFYLDKTFKKGVTEQQARTLKKKQKEGKSIKQYLNDSPTAIYIAATINGQYFKVRTMEKILPVYWDNINQRVKPNHPNAFEFNADLQALKTKIDLEYRNLIANNKNVCVSDVKELIKKVIGGIQPKPDSKNIFELWDEFVEEKKKTVKSITIQRYHSVKVHLWEFHKNCYPITIKKITLQFGVDYNNFLHIKRNHLNNTASKSVETVKVFYRWALSHGYAQNYEFLTYKLKFDYSEIVYLTEQELMKLFNLDLITLKSLDKVRDVFCFQSFTGQRFSDIKNLRWDDLKNFGDEWEWHLFQRKGNKSKKIIVPMSKKAISIIKKYPRYCTEVNSLVLPIMCEQVTNRHLKTLCKSAGFNEQITLVKYRGKERVEISKKKWELISTHCARRTFVTLSLEKRMRPEVVQTITGHEDYKVMKRYIKITDKVKNNEFKMAWDLNNNNEWDPNN